MTKKELSDKLKVLIEIHEDMLKQHISYHNDPTYRFAVGYTEGLKMALSYLKEDEGEVP